MLEDRPLLLFVAARYVPFDFKKESKRKGSDVLAAVERLALHMVRQLGFFCTAPPQRRLLPPVPPPPPGAPRVFRTPSEADASRCATQVLVLEAALEERPARPSHPREGPQRSARGRVPRP